MACPCENNTPTISNCSTCGYDCNQCTCPENPLIPPVVTCPDPVKCDEVYSTECVVYNEESIQCSLDAYQLYPNSIHHIVLSTSTEDQRTVNAMLNNINMQLCYIFSKDYIATMLSIINNDEDLKLLFCNIVNSCDCTCSMTCPTVAVTVYVTDPPVDKMQVTFNLPTGGTSPYTYVVAVYSKLPNGMYTYVSGQTTTSVSILGGSGVALVNLGTSGSSGMDYVVSVQATDSASCVTGSYFNSSTPFNYSDVQNDCGVGFYQGVTTPLNCCFECNTGQVFSVNTVDNRLVHSFTPFASQANCHDATSYVVHWYKYAGNGVYNYMDSETYTPTFTTPLVTQLLGTDPTDTILVMIQTLTADPNCFLGAEPRVSGYFTQAEIAGYLNCSAFIYEYSPTNPL